MAPILLALGLTAHAGAPDSVGGWADVGTGAAGGTGLGVAWRAGAGGMVGSYDPDLLAGRFVEVGVALRGEALCADCTRTAAMGEVRLAAEFLGGGTFAGISAGPEWSTGGRGVLLLADAGLRWRIFGDDAGPTVRLELGASRLDDWTPRGALTVGLDGRLVRGG